MSLDKAWEALLSWSKAKSIEGIELYGTIHHGLRIQKKDRKLDTFEPFKEENIAVRLLKEKSFGFSYTTGTDPDEIINTAQRALENALILEPDPYYGFPRPQNYPDLRLPSGEPPSSEKALKILEEVEQTALTQDKRIKRIQEVSLTQGQTTYFMANSQGIRVQVDVPKVSLFVVVIAEDQKEAQMGWEWQTAYSLDSLSPSQVGAEAAQRALARLGAQVLPSTKLPLLLPPHVGVDFLDLLSHALCGDQVLKGKSFLAEKRGQKVFSSLINILDDGLLPFGGETRPFDDEGLPQQTTILIKEGVLEGFLFDYYWGKRAGENSTGNARRGGFKSPPTVEVTNFFLKPGNASLKDLRQASPKVFEILEVLGMHTADPVSGDFSVGVAGVLHHHGSTQPISGVALAGNVFELFQKVEAVGNDLRFYGSIGAPSLFIGDMDISGS